MISVASGGGAATLHQIRQTEEAEARTAARAHPVVAAVLAAFGPIPDERITVTDLAPPEPETAPPPEDDEAEDDDWSPLDPFGED